MRQSPQEEPQRKGGLITTLSTGFDLTTRHIWIVVLPLVLDVFYWIGPRLRIDKLIEESAAVLREEPAFTDMAEQMIQIGSQFNLFTSLSLPIIGIPALMAGSVPEETPILPAVFQIEDPVFWLVLFLGLSLLGLLFTTLYFVLISVVLHDQKVKVGSEYPLLFKRLLISFIRLFGLGLVFFLALLLVWIPLIPIAFLASFLSSGLFYVVMMVGLVLVMTYLSLSIPAIVLADRPLYKAIRESISLVHKNLSSVIGLLLVVVLIGSGTNLLWHMADNGSWMTLIFIAGNAFISTALVMAIFIFYRDRSVQQLLPNS